MRGKTEVKKIQIVKNNLLEMKKSNHIKIGEMQVELKYSDNNKTINECIINILKQKMKL